MERNVTNYSYSFSPPFSSDFFLSSFSEYKVLFLMAHNGVWVGVCSLMGQRPRGSETKLKETKRSGSSSRGSKKGESRVGAEDMEKDNFHPKASSSFLYFFSLENTIHRNVS